MTSGGDADPAVRLCNPREPVSTRAPPIECQHLPDGLRVAAMVEGGTVADDVPHTLEVEADDVLAVAEALGGGVVVVAHSIAATITVQALRRQTGVIVGAVLYEPPLPGMPAGLESSDAMNAARQEGNYEEALEAFLRDLVKLSPADVQAYQTSPLRPTQLALIWTMSREVSSLYALDAEVGGKTPRASRCVLVVVSASPPMRRELDRVGTSCG